MGRRQRQDHRLPDEKQAFPGVVENAGAGKTDIDPPPVEVGCLLVGELTSILEQCPAQPFERGVGLLL